MCVGVVWVQERKGNARRVETHKHTLNLLISDSLAKRSGLLLRASDTVRAASSLLLLLLFILIILFSSPSSMFSLLIATSSKSPFFFFPLLQLVLLYTLTSSLSKSSPCSPLISSFSPSRMSLTGSDFLKRPLEQYVRRLEIPVRVVRMEQRSGLIRARLKGASLSTGQVCDATDTLHTLCTSLEEWP